MKRDTQVRRSPRQGRNDNDPVEVGSLLQELAPAATEDSVREASISVLKAIEDYRRALKWRQGTGVSPPETTAQARKDLRNLILALDNCQKAVSPSRMSLRSYGRFLRENGSAANLKRELSRAVESAGRALDRLALAPAHEGDVHAPTLAARLRYVLGSQLMLRVVMTRDGDLTRPDQKASANYCRLLRLSLRLAGVKPPEDLLPLMKKGKALGEDEGLWEIHENLLCVVKSRA